MGYILFFLLSIICVGAVLGMIISKNQAYSALFLVLAFAVMGGIFALLEAPFIAVVQIIIYAGAIMVLFVFVIMMVDIKEGFPPEKKKWTLGLSIALGIILLVELIFSIKGTFQAITISGVENISSPKILGKLLFTKYLYPFEITSILIIAALVGAIVLIKNKGES